MKVTVSPLPSFASGETPATEWQGFRKLKTALEAWAWVVSGIAAASFIMAWQTIR